MLRIKKTIDAWWEKIQFTLASVYESQILAIELKCAIF